MDQYNEVVLNKHTPSVFQGTAFELLMRNLGRETLLFTGLVTNIGVDSSAREASARGFYSLVVSDCVSTNDRELHEASLKSIASVCIVISSEEIIKAWQ